MAASTTGRQTTPPAKTKKTRAKSKPKSAKKAKTNAQTKLRDARSVAFRREASGLVLLMAALGILLSLVSFDIADLDAAEPMNWIGPLGVHVAASLLFVFGVAAFFFDAILWFLGICLLLGKAVEWKLSQVAGQFVFVISGAMLSHLWLVDVILLGHTPGGLVGEFSGELTRSVIGTIGASIAGVGGVLMGVMLITGLSLGMILRRVLGFGHRGVALAKHKFTVHREYRARLKEEREKLRDLEGAARAEAELEATPIAPEKYDFEDNKEEEVEKKLSDRLSRLKPKSKKTVEDPQPEEVASPTEPEAIPDALSAMEKVSVEIERDRDWSLGDVPKVAADPDLPDELKKSAAVEIEVTDTDIIENVEEVKGKDVKVVDLDFGPQIVESKAAKRKREQNFDEDGPIFKPRQVGQYAIPPLKFLNFERGEENAVDTDHLRAMAAQIEQTLSDFKVEGQIVEICPGPVITMFEFSPAPGVKISKIANLSDDLAMALSAISVRIVAPIPGKGVVGIEVPNPKREMVFLKEIIGDDVFQKNTKMQLPMALGFDVEGAPIVADLAKMPHLLVAGATGSGKSVAVNTMICSLLYKHTPEDVRMIMVDPKMLEFSIYADIPHLLLPVVTDPKQATVALNWAVQEMERRYQNLADMGVRNIKGYNEKVERLTKRAELDQLEGREESEAMAQLGIDANGKARHQKIPFIVVIVDEFADLMMTAAKDVETAVARLAQKARAAGIHLILATQRPSTDVVTGLIKANFPTRVALRVTSKIDSRVILDSNGAENLLGNGDMLFVPPGSSALTRVHGAYVSETEIDQMVDFLKEQGEPEYDESILVEEDEDGPNIEDMERDEHYEDAVRLVVESQQASISKIQRKLRVGYNRAARMVEMMEAENIVSAADGCKPREVLVDASPY